MTKKQSATIYDVAKEVGVSLATVSRVVNGNSNVREATKNKVLAAIKQLGYQPNAVARGLASKKSTTIGVVVPDITDMYYAELARGIDDVANMYHYDVLLTNTDDDPVRAMMALDNLATKQVDGIIFLGNALDDDVLKRMTAIRVPVVLAGGITADGCLPSVTIDYRSAVAEVTRLLLTHQHERIALITGPMNQAVNQHFRFAGYSDAFVANGQSVDDTLVYPCRQDYRAGQRLGEQLLHDNVTAAVIFDDEVALGLMTTLRDRGCQVPADFEVITSNDTKLSRMTRPDLTSIAQPKYDIGAVAMRMLTKLMSNEPLADTQVILPYTIEHRRSTREMVPDSTK